MFSFDVTFYSFLSGTLAGFVSLCLKLAFNTQLILLENFYLFDLVSAKLIVQILFVLSSLGLNSLMWIVYAKGLQLSSSTLYDSSLNKFSNFITSAVCGYLLFEEKIKLITWLIGLAFLLTGILILNERNKQLQQKAKHQ